MRGSSRSSLGERLRAIDVPEPDDVALARLRSRVLEEAERVSTYASARPPRPRRSRPALVVMIAAAAAIALFVAWRRPWSASVETALVTTDEGGARYSQHDEQDVRHVDLLDGSLGLRVDRVRGGKRVVVQVPDGQIEDIGTVFHVVVSEGHTRRVRVDEGSVVVRLEGRPPETVTRGQTWERPAAPPPPLAPAPAASGAAPEIEKSSNAPPHPSPPPPQPRVKPAAPPSPSAVPAPSSSSSESPSDDEDRAYLEILRLLREGRREDAKSAGRDYVRRFPHGFRRAEVDRVLAP